MATKRYTKQAFTNSRRVSPLAVGTSGAISGLVVILSVSPAFAADYNVDGAQYDSIADVPWSELSGGDTVFIHWREEPYHESFGIEVSGDSWDAPIRITGVEGPDGSLPVIDGSNADSGPGAHPRGLISVRGGSEYITIENLVVRGANQDNGFPKGSSSIYAENGYHLLLDNLTLTDSDNGLFSAPETGDLIVRACTIYGNGVEGSIYEHNSYTESDGILFEFNTYGLLRSGALGNNLKDRSAHMVVRYNWIDGGNRPLDLVEPEYGQDAYGDAAANQPHFVYGNTLLKRNDGTSNDQVVHFGGDGSGPYRRFLYFYHNTIYSTRSGTSVFLFNVDNAEVDIRNNVIYTAEGASSLRLFDSDTPDSAEIILNTNYIVPGHGGSSPGGVLEEGTVGGAPAFRDAQNESFYPGEGSPLLDVAVPIASGASDHPVEYQFVSGGLALARGDDVLDLGAFEACDSDCGTPAPPPSSPDETTTPPCQGASCNEDTGSESSGPGGGTDGPIDGTPTGGGGDDTGNGNGGSTSDGMVQPTNGVTPTPTRPRPGDSVPDPDDTSVAGGDTSGRDNVVGDAGDAVAAAGSGESDCSCRVPGASRVGGLGALWVLAAVGLRWLRRRGSN